MLTIENYKKIQNRWFGEWQIGKIDDFGDCYGLQVFHKSGRSITIAIFKDGKMDSEFFEKIYDIKLVEDGNGNVIHDTIYHATLNDMELFGEALVHYLNTI